MDDIDPESGDAMDNLLANAVSLMDNQGSPIHDGNNTDDNDSDLESNSDHGMRKRRNRQAWGMNNVNHTPDPKVKIALSLYKVQQNIYQLDFQRLEVQ